MVEIQDNGDFWTIDCLEISFLAAKQLVGLRLGRSTAVLFP